MVSTVVLYVFFPLALPKIVPFTFDDPMSSGESAQVICSVSYGDQPMKFSWSFNGDSVAALAGASTMEGGRKASILLLDPLGAIHSGNYTCTVQNRAGVANFTAELRINGKICIRLFHSPTQNRAIFL